MSSAILIPTYRKHFELNVRFMASIIKNNEPSDIPDVFFATSTLEEKVFLLGVINRMFPDAAKIFHVFDLDEVVCLFNDVISDRHYDTDSTHSFEGGRYSLINLKKMKGISEIFNQGFDTVVVLDSETVQYKKYPLGKFINDISYENQYRFSPAAYHASLMTKIQHDSIRTVVNYYDVTHKFSTSYGWFDNLCVYEKNCFNQFIDYMAADCASVDDNDRLLHVVNKFKGMSFEWLVYKTYQIFVCKNFKDSKNIDDLIMDATGHPAKYMPQTENLYQYLTGVEENDAVFLSVIMPPWVPYTKDKYILALLNKYLPDSCCLMFHLDRLNVDTHRERAIRALKRLIKNVLSIKELL